jgi:hypothetical protein
MTILYPCGVKNLVHSNGITPKHDAIISVAVSTKCTTNLGVGPKVTAEDKDGSETYEQHLAKPGGVASFTVPEGGKAYVRCDGTGTDGCSVEVTVIKVEKS